MAGDREKGKIAHSEWSKIVARYRAGETIAQIGRDYGCTAPAIRYIVKRTGAFHAGAEGGTGAERASKLQPSRSAAAEAVTARAGGASAGGARQDRILGTELRQRVSGDIASFLVALDQAVIEGSPRSAAELQEATDRLMRSTARVRLELERLLTGEQRPARAVKAQAASSARGA